MSEFYGLIKIVCTYAKIRFLLRSDNFIVREKNLTFAL